MARSSGAASMGDRLRERRSSRIKSSSGATPFVAAAPCATSPEPRLPGDGGGLCAVLPGCSSAKTAANLKQSKKIRILTSEALSSLSTCVHHTTLLTLLTKNSPGDFTSAMPDPAFIFDRHIRLSFQQIFPTGFVETNYSPARASQQEWPSDKTPTAS